MSKPERSIVDSNAWVEAVLCIRRKDKHARAVTSSAQWPRRLGRSSAVSPKKKKYARTVISSLSFLEFSLFYRVFLSFMWLRSAARAVILSTGGSEVLNIRVFACSVAQKCCSSCYIECRWLRSAEHTCFCMFRRAYSAEHSRFHPAHLKLLRQPNL